MHPPDPTSILAAAVSALGVAAPVPLARVARGDGDWYSPVAHRLTESSSGRKRVVDIAADLASQLRAQPEVSWAGSWGSGVVFSVHTTTLARTLAAGSSPPPPSAGSHPASGPHPATVSALSQDWPADLRPVALAHARSKNQGRAAAAHGVRPIEDLEETDVGQTDIGQTEAAESKPAAQVTAVLAEPHARALLVHVTTLMALQRRGRTEPLLLRESASQFQNWFAATRITPRGTEPVTSYHRIRLALNHATAIALAAGLASLGLDAPEHL